MSRIDAITPPPSAALALERLGERGCQAFLAGGCVRDCLLGRAPGDWDVATDAQPSQVMELFSDYRVIPTGVQHGTVTVVIDHSPIEITTFRVDGAYSDNRRPDSVTFTSDLGADLSRRDFTVNAMAWSPDAGLVDCFGGREDLERGLIRCVGEPEARFREDALRILRGARFACTLGFGLEAATREAMLALSPLLEHVAAERIAAELRKAIRGPGFGRTFGALPSLLEQVLPELFPIADEAAYATLLRCVDSAPPEPSLRLGVLFRLQGGDTARRALTRLRCDNETIRSAASLADGLSRKPPETVPDGRRLLRDRGEEAAGRLLKGWEAVALGTEDTAALEAARGAARITHGILERGDCYRLGDLAVTGTDLLALGLPPGPGLGSELERLLDLVIDGAVENDRQALLDLAAESTGSTG